MSEYEFTVILRLPDANADPEQFIEALAEAGCDDATIDIGQRGHIALDFTREADTAREAIVSAVHAIRQAIPGAELVSGAHRVPGAELPEELESLFV